MVTVAFVIIVGRGRNAVKLKGHSAEFKRAKGYQRPRSQKYGNEAAGEMPRALACHFIYHLGTKDRLVVE